MSFFNNFSIMKFSGKIQWFEVPAIKEDFVPYLYSSFLVDEIENDNLDLLDILNMREVLTRLIKCLNFICL